MTICTILVILFTIIVFALKPDHSNKGMPELWWIIWVAWIALLIPTFVFMCVKYCKIKKEVFAEPN